MPKDAALQAVHGFPIHANRSVKSGRTSRARSTNSLTASEVSASPIDAGTDSERNGTICSPSTPSAPLYGTNTINSIQHKSPPHLPDLTDLTLAATERRQLQRQIRLLNVQRPQYSELTTTDLPHPLHAAEIAQPMLAKITQITTVAHQLDGRRAAHNLSAMRNAHQTCATVQRRTEIIPVAQLGLAGVQPI